MSNFPLAVNTIGDTWTVSAEASMSRLAALGYRYFDVMVSPMHLDTQNFNPVVCRRLRRFMADEGLSICSFTSPSLDHNLASPRSEVRAMTVDFVRSMAVICCELEIPGIVTSSGRVNSLNAPPRSQLEGWLRSSIDSILPYAEELGVKLFLENLPMGVLPRAEQLVSFVQEVQHPYLRICYDVSNANFISEDPASGIRLVSPYLELLHLSDTTQESWQHAPIGSGSVDFGAVSQALREIDYNNMSVLEILAPDDVIVANHAVLANLGWNALGSVHL